MKLIIDLVLLVIIAVCVWTGYKRGIIGGISGILAIILSLFGGSLLSSAYSHEVVPALEPFVSGIVDSETNKDDVLEKLGYGESDYSLSDILASDSSLRYDYAYESILNLGLYSQRAEELAQSSVSLADEQGLNMTEAVVSVVCDTVSYVAGLAVAFLMILILLFAIGNIGNLTLTLNNSNIDEAGGAALGFVKGFVYCVLISWFLSFFGIIIGRETLAGTTLARFFLLFRFITDSFI